MAKKHFDEIIDFREFVNGNYRQETTTEKIIHHFEKHHVIYEIAGVSLALFLVPHFAFAADGGNMDVKAEKLYHKLCRIGKWVIVGKGGWETINSAVKHDFDSAKKNFISYLLIYVILLALPFGMDQVDEMFQSFGSDK